MSSHTSGEELSSFDSEEEMESTGLTRIRNCDQTSKSALPQNVSKWTRQHAKNHLGIYYAGLCIVESKDLLQNLSGTVKELTKEQLDYIAFANKHLTFSTTLKSFREQSRLVKEWLNKCDAEIKELQVKGGNHWVLNLKDFVAGLKILLKDMQERIQPYECFIRDFIAVFAKLCGLRVQYCNSSRQVIWRKLKGINVKSEPDIRLFKYGLDHEYSDTMVSVIKVKPDPVDTVEPHERPRKKFRGSPRHSCSNSEDEFSNIEPPEPADGDETIIELYLHDKVLGQHAGELLLDLHNKHKLDEYQEAMKNQKITMLGMICDRTRVYFTLLEMTRKHYQNLKDNKDLDSDDKATIYYTHSKDILLEYERKSLLADFMRLNNIDY